MTTMPRGSLFQWSLFLSKSLLFRSTTALLVTRRSSFAVQASRFGPFLDRNTLARMTATSSSSAATTAAKSTAPPVARRDEDHVVWAGVAPPNWNADIPRQSEASTEALLDPAMAVPDPYGWMRDEKREKEEVLEHLKAENAFTEGLMSHLGGLRERLYQEMVDAIQETDYSLPRPVGNWYYYTRTFTGKSYTVHCRAPKTTEPLHVNWDGTAGAPILKDEQVLLDVNELAKDKKYCATGTVKHSPSHKLLAYSTDFTGGETCQLFVKNLDTGEIVDHDPKLEIDGQIRWGADDHTLFYIKLDDAHRPFQLYRRKLDNDDPDELLLEEKDELYWMGISKSLDGNFLFVDISSKETSEVHYLDLTDPAATLQCVAKRRLKVLYDVEHRKGKWWITSNVGELPNMALWIAPAVPTCQDEWKLVTDASSGVVLFDGGYDRSLDSISCFTNHIVAQGREGGLPRVWISRLSEDAVQSLEVLTFEEDAYDAGLGVHYEFDTNKIVVGYDSLVTPTQSIEIAMDDTTQRTVVKERVVPGYERAQYGCDRITVRSRDGTTQIPVSLVYRKDVMEQNLADGEPVHVHLYGYGSYGSPEEADFRSTRLPLLNRGIVYVIAHVRGGGEMGRQWYEEPNGAKYLCKKNTFNDFVDVARWLVEDRKLTSPDLLSCEGRSAGGLLIGASINQAPELFKMAVLGVPFVDVVCTMIDASIPLTAAEWEEWGNPNEEKYFQTSKSPRSLIADEHLAASNTDSLCIAVMEYSPMQNVKPSRYPACLLTGGLHDPRVQYWEPAKFAAELRHTQAPDSGPVCLKIDMSAGHFSASDRYKYLRELAFDYAFLLDQMGLAAN